MAAALNVTVTDSTGTGYWTIYPAGTTRPVASNLNVNGAGATVANQVLARLDNGQASFYAQSGGNVVVDLVGWFTGDSAAASSTGLFVPVTPARVLDSRQAPLGLEPGMNRTAEVAVEGRFGVPAGGVGAVVLNATITQSSGAGLLHDLAGPELSPDGLEHQRHVRGADRRQPRDHSDQHRRLRRSTRNPALTWWPTSPAGTRAMRPPPCCHRMFR